MSKRDISTVEGICFPVIPEHVNRIFKRSKILFPKLLVHDSLPLYCKAGQKFFFYKSHSNKEIVGEGIIRKLEMLSYDDFSSRINESFLSLEEFNNYVNGRNKRKIASFELCPITRYKTPIKLNYYVTMGGKMNLELIQQKANEVAVKKYWNGIAIDENISKSKNNYDVYLNFLKPKRVFDEELNTEFLYFIKLNNIGVISFNEKGNVINQSEDIEIMQNCVERYKEVHSLREKLVLRLVAEKLIAIPGIHQTLTPLRIVLDAFYRKDYNPDSLSSFFDKKQKKAIKFLLDLGYLRKEGKLITLDNHYIKKLEKEIGNKDRDIIFQKLMANVFIDSYRILIKDMKWTILVPYIGIVTTYYNLVMDFRKNIKIPTDYLYKEYKDLYQSGLNKQNFRDKLKDISKRGIFQFDNVVFGIDSIVKSVLDDSKKLDSQSQLVMA